MAFPPVEDAEGAEEEVLETMLKDLNDWQARILVFLVFIDDFQIFCLKGMGVLLHWRFFLYLLHWRFYENVLCAVGKIPCTIFMVA